MKLRLAEQLEEDDIDITPMLDCIFLLVLFFMVTASFVEEAQAFKITLPRADQATRIAAGDADSISVTADGRYFLRQRSGDPKPLTNLEEFLTKLKEDKGVGQRPFILRADAKCEYQQIMQVKNVLKLAGVETIFEEVEVRHDKRKP
ncbi:MAG: biopolymer transporter ExbD [Planctomycetes bacterium]|nr:biopolymer transporter ExbD [Planctomycetota bacterium]